MSSSSAARTWVPVIFSHDPWLPQRHRSLSQTGWLAKRQSTLSWLMQRLSRIVLRRRHGQSSRVFTNSPACATCTMLTLSFKRSWMRSKHGTSTPTVKVTLSLLQSKQLEWISSNG